MPALLLAQGCHSRGSRPDVLLVTIDTLRSDHCSAYGYPVPTTPNMAALARKGVLYRRAYAESSTTAPSHAVLMTGRHFRTLGVDRNGGSLPAEALTLAEKLKDSGYATAAFVSSFPLITRFGFSQGFEYYEDQFDPDVASLGRRKPGKPAHDRIAEATVARLRQWLGERKAKDRRPLFLWVHFVDPHAPYRAPEKFAAKWPKATPAVIERYDAEVRYADKQLGRVLRMLRKDAPGRERLVVVTSDHGEGLGDHGWISHGVNLHEEAVRVPLVASWPERLPAGTVVEEPVGLLDIAPGILDLLGLDASEFAHGRKLFGPADAARAIFLQRRDYKSVREHGLRIGGEMTAIVENGAKLIVAPGEERRELYDLMTDPRELHDRLAQPDPSAEAASVALPAGAGTAAATVGRTQAAAAANEATARKLEDSLQGWKQSFPASEPSGKPIDEETLKALRSLGYVD